MQAGGDYAHIEDGVELPTPLLLVDLNPGEVRHGPVFHEYSYRTSSGGTATPGQGDHAGK